MSDDSQRPESRDERIELSVVHGHLAFARFPVLVGHYRGDAFAGTEARLDRALGSRLSERRKLGLYPGRIGTNAILLNPNCRPCGAVVVGLDQPAGLSIGALRETLRQGILAFVVEVLDRGCLSGPADTKSRVGLSTLLVGAGEGGIDRNSCVQSLLQATSQANAMLAGLQKPGARLGTLEIIELYEDRAYETWRVLTDAVGSDAFLKGVFELPPLFKQRDGGRRNAPIAQDPNWWQPIQITMPRVEGPNDRSLSFTVGGGFARAEARTIAANLDIVSPLLRRTAQNVDLDGAPISPGRILFELLWPDSLKHRSAEEQNRRLILDEASAAFPWELLDDRRPWMSAGVPAGPGRTARRPGRTGAAIVAGAVLARRSSPPRGKPKALVIGDPGAEPMKGFPRLPGAEAEARAVAELLCETKQSHDVTLLVKAAATPDQIFKQLLGQAWEIVHISAHGVVDYEMTGADGIGGRSPASFSGAESSWGHRNCRNCRSAPASFSSIAAISARSTLRPKTRLLQESLEGRPELAASVAVQLIQLGVRCVIVAGWEVDDDCAQAFGQRFYSEMLDGEQLRRGDAAGQDGGLSTQAK